MAAKIIAELQRIAPARLTWRQLATMLGKSPDGGYFRTGKRDAFASGQITEEGEYVRAVGAQAAPLTRTQAIGTWSEILGQPASAIVAALEAVARDPKPSWPT